jgi:H+/Cl- antiporter ClcA
MHAVRISRLFALIGTVVFCAFAGDIVADSIADLRGDHCTSQCSESDQQHEKAPCSHCSCAVHNGTVITSTAAVHITGVLQVSIFFPASDQSTPTGLPAAIDHPPQLA